MYFLYFFLFFGFVFIVLSLSYLVHPAYQSISKHIKAYQVSKEENKYPTWGMHVRTACGVRIVFLDGAWSFWHLQIACLHQIVWTVCSAQFFFLASKRSRRNRPRRVALVQRTRYDVYRYWYAGMYAYIVTTELVSLG